MSVCDLPATDVLRIADPDDPFHWAGTWSILRTAPNSEQVAADLLWKNGIQNYLPRYEVETQYAKRRYVRMVPVFSRYLPVCAQPGDDLHEIRRFFGSYFGGEPINFTDGDGVVSHLRQSRFVGQLSAIYRAEQMGKLRPMIRIPEKGQRCRIIDGAFHDFECIVLDTKRRQFVVKLPDQMGAAELMIEPERLEIIEPDAN